MTHSTDEIDWTDDEPIMVGRAVAVGVGAGVVAFVLFWSQNTYQPGSYTVSPSDSNSTIEAPYTPSEDTAPPGPPPSDAQPPYAQPPAAQPPAAQPPAAQPPAAEPGAGSPGSHIQGVGIAGGVPFDGPVFNPSKRGR